MKDMVIGISVKIGKGFYELLEVAGEDSKKALLKVRKIEGKEVFNVFWFKQEERFSKVFSHYEVA